MRMLDLFCGRWGWSKAFAARGWECVGVDLTEPPEVPDGCMFIQADVLKMGWLGGDGLSYCREDGEFTLGSDFDFICASSPCEQFSVHGMKHFHPNPPYPELGIKLFNHTRSICEASGLPYVMENVRAAQQFVGQAVNHCGPFYLWGTGVPPLMPQGIRKADHFRAMPDNERIKTLKAGLDLKTERNKWQRIRETTEYFGMTGTRCTWSGSKARAEMTARTATIPPELAVCVADYAEAILREEVST